MVNDTDVVRQQGYLGKDVTGNEDGLPSANPLEIAELKRRLEPFLLKLPEYRPLAEQLMSSKDNT